MNRAQTVAWITLTLEKVNASRETRRWVIEAYSSGWEDISDGSTFSPDFFGRKIKNPAAVTHDFLYSHNIRGLTRRQKDVIFRNALHDLGFPCLKWLYWAGVRVFGRFFYQEVD